MDEVKKIAKYLKIRTSDVYPLASGEYNRNYLFKDANTGENRVFRINTGSQMHLSHQIEYEAHALKCLLKSGRTPQVYKVDGSKTYFSGGILIMEFLPGRSLDYRNKRDLLEAAKILGDIHGTEIPDGCQIIKSGNPLLEILKECEEMFSVYRDSSLSDPEKEQQISRMLKKGYSIAKTVQNAPFPKAIINTELNSGNFLINENEASYLVDWEKPLIGDPAQDLGHFLAPTTTFWKTDDILTEEEMQDFLEMYYAEGKKNESLSDIKKRVDAYIPVTCLRGLTWSSMAWIQYQEPGRAITNEDTWQKLNRYLSNVFLDEIEKRYF